MDTIINTDIGMRAYARVVMEKIVQTLDETLVVQCGRKHSIMPGLGSLYTDEDYTKVYPKRIPQIELLVDQSIFERYWVAPGKEDGKAKATREKIERALRDDHQIMVRALELVHRMLDPTLHIKYYRTASQLPGIYEFDINLCSPDPDRFSLCI